LVLPRLLNALAVLLESTKAEMLIVYRVLWANIQTLQERSGAPASVGSEGS